MTHNAPLGGNTAVKVAGEEDRATALIVRLIDHHVGTPGPLLTRLARENGPVAREVVLRALGYVPQDPEAWFRLHLHRHRFDGGRTCPGFVAS